MAAAIRSQPEALRRIAIDEREPCSRAADLLRGARRVLLVGTGTSLHAAQVGEHLLRASGSDTYAVSSFDFVLYPRRIGTGDAVIVISHRGAKRYSALAMARAAAAGARVIAITGQDAPSEGAAVTVRTVAQETSSAHTASYLGAVAVLAQIAVVLGEQAGIDVSALALGRERLPDSIAEVLTREDEVAGIARSLAAGAPRFIFTGGGPNAATAAEGALKIKETCYLTAEGMPVEQFLHGPIVALEPGDMLVAVCAEGPSMERLQAACRAAADINARIWAIGTDTGVAGVEHFPVQPLPEPLSPAALAVPLQLLALHLALARGTDPDSFRLTDARYRRAVSRWTM
jgi:glucosamine--fructose-6-phosphate aminotransferase (isomerizing)